MSTSGEIRTDAADAARRVLMFNAAPAGEDRGGLLAAMQGADILSLRHLAGRGASEGMGAHIRDILAEADWLEAGPDLIVAVRGPGSFTGLRASLALAQGLSQGFGCQLLGVTVGACYRAQYRGERVWTVTHARRDRVFVESPEGELRADAPSDVDIPAGVLIVGDAASLMEGRFGGICRFAEDVDAQPLPRYISAAARTALPTPHNLIPLYVDPPEAKPPSAGLRPAPVP